MKFHESRPPHIRFPPAPPQGGREHFSTAQALLRAAADRLYRSKLGGCNRVSARSIDVPA
ncbi:hypothetical protein XthCFBP4691_00340 [Xanthomonas theicola]|uniref:Uncharacterized protein n=1 Tax=Xanthomonas theicola TaxID=56464 RepID=A0A2S6ZMC4_9XANT|nr:hypothetical protein XthCFBP4691_00340 [Xanthomonas theicola]